MGRQQAKALSQKLAQTRFEHIYTSPIPRAVETAQLLAEALQLPLRLEPALIEYDCGELEGRSDPQSWEIHQQFVYDWFNGLQRDKCPPGGETFYDIQTRMQAFLETLAHSHPQKDSHLLCVSHGGTLAFGLPELLQNISFNFSRQNIPAHTDLIIAEYSPEGWLCAQWGQTSYK